MRAAGAVVTVADRSQQDSAIDAEYIQADFSDARSVELLCGRLRSASPDILINLAGLNAFCAFPLQTAAEIEAVISVNLTAPVRLSQAVLGGMLERGSGQIVNVGSIVGSIGIPHFTVYTATKAGLRGFSEALRRELSGSGVCVTHIAPRAVRTPMNHGAIGEFNRRSHTVEDLPGTVARRIVRAIEREETSVTIGFPEKLYVKINALWPKVIDGPLIRNRQIATEILAAHSYPLIED